MWERNGPFTDAAKTTEGTNPHNSTNQRADFRLIRPAPRQGYQIATRTTRQNKKKKEERKGYLTRNKRTRLFEKEPGNLMDNGDRNRKVKDNSEDKIRYITSRRLQILKTRFVTLQATSKIEDYKSYKTQRTRH